MNRTILALALIGMTGIAASAQAEDLRLSDVPPGAIHTPGIGPGYIYPAYPIATIDAGDLSVPSTAMMQGGLAAEQIPVMGSSHDRVLSRLRTEGFTNVQHLRQMPDGSWSGNVTQRGGMATVSVTSDGVVSLSQ